MADENQTNEEQNASAAEEQGSSTEGGSRTTEGGSRPIEDFQDDVAYERPSREDLTSADFSKLPGSNQEGDHRQQQQQENQDNQLDPTGEHEVPGSSYDGVSGDLRDEISSRIDEQTQRFHDAGALSDGPGLNIFEQAE